MSTFWPQSDRLENFSILTICEKRIENFGHDLIFKKWDQLDVIYPGIDRPRNYVDKETGIELEIFILQEEFRILFFTFTLTLTFSSQRKSLKKLAKLRGKASKLGTAYKNMDKFLGNLD